MVDKKVYCDFIEIAENEFKKLVKKGDLSAAEMESAKNVLSAIVKATDICDRREMDEEYAQRGHSYGDDPYRRWEILSYGNRHMMPRYSMTDRGYDESYRGRDYSRHSIKDRAVDKLERLMDEAGSDYERQKIKEMIHHIEGME